MKNSQMMLTSALAILATACGQKSDDKKEAVAAATATTNTYALSAVATTQIDDAMEALADGSASSAASLNLTADSAAGRYGMSKPAWTPTCKVEDGNAVVTWMFDQTPDEQTQTMGAGRYIRTSTRTRTGSLVRTWTGPSGSPVACSAGTHAQLDWKTATGITGLSLKMEATRAKADTTTLKTAEGVEILSVSKTFDAKGSRLVTWGAPTVDATAKTVTLVKTVSESDMTRTAKVVITKSGSAALMKKLPGIAKNAQDLEVNTKVTVESPLKIAVVRSTETNRWITRTITEGVTVATQADKSVVKSEFSDVKFELAGEAGHDPCMPISGTITGKAYASAEDSTDESKATKSYVITFASGVASIAIDGAEAQEMDDYQPQCDLAD